MYSVDRCKVVCFTRRVRLRVAFAAFAICGYVRSHAMFRGRLPDIPQVDTDRARAAIVSGGWISETVEVLTQACSQ